jgi:hypothetical protein
VAGNWGESISGAGSGGSEIYLRLQDVALAGYTSGGALSILSGVGGTEWARFTASGLSLTSPLAVSSGGTATNNQVTNGANFFDGTKITSGTALTFNGTNLTLNSTTGTSTIASGQGFTIGGSQFALQQGSGNVGIGTASPSAKLHIVDTAANTGLIYEFGNSSTLNNYTELKLRTYNFLVTNAEYTAIRGITDSITP